MNLHDLREELQTYYTSLRKDRIARNDDFVNRRDAIFTAMDAYEGGNPHEHPCLLKARLHEEIARCCEPKIFRFSPFFFEMGVRPAESWGTPDSWSAASWMLLRRHHRVGESDAMRQIAAFRSGNPESRAKLWLIWDVFDYDHHCLGYTRLLRIGVNGLLAEIADRRSSVVDADEAAFLEAAERGCRALIAVAGRFATRAANMLQTERDPQARRYLQRIAESAAWVPAHPPRNFYEGLAMLWFLREATASMEGIGISVLGHLDRQLIDLYRSDLAAGRLTEDEAYDLLARWMLPTDVKFHVDDNSWPETSTCMELGGCDADGKPVYNELTRLILNVHRGESLLNPKPNCRVSTTSNLEFLEQIASAVIAGHNNFALINDDVLIPACVKAGKTIGEARLYVNGGCQETIVEGVEHSAGAYFYFNLARAFDLVLRPLDETHSNGGSVAAAEKLLPATVGAPSTFEEFYLEMFDKISLMIRLGADWTRELGQRTPEIQPCPLFSASLLDCIAKGRDYTAGGARYNPSGIALVGFGTMVDSLAAIRQAVFEDGWLELDALKTVLAANWEGCESLRAKMVGLPKFGENNPVADDIAKRLAADLADFGRRLENERGDHFQTSFFVYHMFYRMGFDVRATPDGRHDANVLNQGVMPGRVRPSRHLTDVFRSISHVDFTDHPGNSVLDIQLPCGDTMPAETLVGIIRSFTAMNGPTLQFNCVSVETLRQAQLHPERHADLIVRIAGLSAHFVALQREVQDEIINRTLMEAS